MSITSVISLLGIAFSDNSYITDLVIATLPKMEKHKFASISLTMLDRAISSFWQFSKNFPLPKNGGRFEFLPKMAKHKFASISLTVRDRAILLKFSTHRVCKQCNLCNFQNIFPSLTMAAILNF